MKKYLILFSILFPLFACQNNNPNIEVNPLVLPSEYQGLIQTLDSLYAENVKNTDYNLEKKIKIIEKILLEQYPDFVSTGEDADKEGIEQDRGQFCVITGYKGNL